MHKPGTTRTVPAKGLRTESLEAAAQQSQVPRGRLIDLHGETYYRIDSFDRLPAFLMSLATDSDLWMFISSRGGLSAGRKNSDGSLFPYETVDKLHDAQHHTGPLTLLRIQKDAGAEILWEPFADQPTVDEDIERTLYKNATGNRLVLEEAHRGLGLVFRYRWSAADALGLVRTASVINSGETACTVRLLDGLRNILPYGIPLALQQKSSSLVDAYKRVDVDPHTRMALFSLTAKILDRAEAAEVLRANVVWCHGLEDFDVFVSQSAVSAFRHGKPLPRDGVLKGQRGNYLVEGELTLKPGATSTWHIVADVGLSHVQLADLQLRLLQKNDLGQWIDAALLEATQSLRRNVGSADGLQLSAQQETTVHHFANVLFNNMRGGVFANNYQVNAADLVAFLRSRNHTVADKHERLLMDGPPEISMQELKKVAAATRDADFQRLCFEYLPLYFGRRHGDPSRPWNTFNIQVSSADGGRALHYEGNWRDVFQNWEALSWSFPGFLPNLVAKFVNASTVDGFNPYRISREGVDWEVVDADDPWSNIGYWGDHQIVYLLKLLEALPRFLPGALEDLLLQELFSYADVPYRLKSYGDMVENPHETIVFDTLRQEEIAARVSAMGNDGKLLLDEDGAVYHVTLLEKLLVPALSKLSNFVLDGGIWMNTQRPEWNDANNALVGRGVSVVTLCYLRRYVAFVEEHVASVIDQAMVSSEVLQWLERLVAILEQHQDTLSSDADPGQTRKDLLDSLGMAFEEYRDTVYSKGFSGKRPLARTVVQRLCVLAREYLDHGIRANRRQDGLYHSYNLLTIHSGEPQASLQPLYEMLEGQVAVLSAGVLPATDTVELVEHLYSSRLYRDDQRSFLLYPEKELPGFLERNVVPEEHIWSVPLLQKLHAAGDTSVVEKDALGVFRFHGDFENAHDLTKALDALAQQDAWSEQVQEDRQAVLQLFEEVFHHASFTGRSGTMYAYEGLGSVYWHMVAKLLLAVQENLFSAIDSDEPASVLQAMKSAYYRIRSGLGFEKSVVKHGAVPTDPYSHTPKYAGAQQPGMTGQVKEEILTRLGELGVHVVDGVLSFRPALLRRDEFLEAPGRYEYYDLEGKFAALAVPSGAMAFSFCQTPILYELSPDAWVRVVRQNGETTTIAASALDAETCQQIYARSGSIRRIEVGITEQSLYQPDPSPQPT